MSTKRYKIATNNNPDIIVTLVADGYRALQMWENTYNESRYISNSSQATNGGMRPTDPSLRDISPSPEDTFRETTPSGDDLALDPVPEPAVQFAFSKPPKNPELGFLLGSDEEVCDMFLGSSDDCISRRMLSISFNEYNEVILNSTSGNKTQVSYSIDGIQSATRKTFTWVFPIEVEKIFVNVAGRIQFWVVVPTHELDKAAYEANCREFKKLADSASHTLSLLNFSSRPDTRFASGAASTLVTTEPPFYLRTVKIGEGGFGAVYKGRSMPDGGIVAVKRFRSKDAWTLEADVLQKLSKTPHENVVRFIDFGLGNRPFLVMGLASGGNLEQQHRLMPFTAREIGRILQQMLQALKYLHVDFSMIHRDMKPANILCDSRTHFRLADFGLAKEGDFLKTVKGTQPYMAPEMFEDKPYTAAVDLWGLGMVIIRFLIGSSPPGYKGNEGHAWCNAVIAHFGKYEERFGARSHKSQEQFCINVLVRRHLLRMKPEERESAHGCLERGKLLWRVLDEHKNDGSKDPARKDPTESLASTSRANNANGPSQDSGAAEKRGAYENNGLSRKDDDSEAEIEISGERTLNSDDWLSLERQFPNNEAYGEGNAGRFSGSHHFVHAPTADKVPEDSTTPEFNEHSGANAPQHSVTPSTRKEISRGLRPVSPAAPMGVRKSVHKRNKSSLSTSVAAAVAQRMAEKESQEQSQEQSQNEEEISLDDYYKPGRPGYLLNPENRAFIGAGETLDLWIMGNGPWPGEDKASSHGEDVAN